MGAAAERSYLRHWPEIALYLRAVRGSMWRWYRLNPEIARHQRMGRKPNPGPTHLAIEEISCPVRDYGGSRPDAIAIEAATTERTKIALEIRHAKDASRLPLRGTSWMVGTVADYEAYLVYRKEVAKTSARIVQMAASMVDPEAH